MAEYTIIIERAEGNYSAYCPDLPGCIATGSTIEKTTQRMKEAIKFHLEGLKDGEIAIPEPSTKAVSIEVTA
ncbi:hypothetical protein C5S29_01630 [ANME-1 cluster archaeon GoMg3.2]|nr:hypothetical protein [ANME-1 cluster archaeon GoMg3.2]